MYVNKLVVPKHAITIKSTRRPTHAELQACNEVRADYTRGLDIDLQLKNEMTLFRSIQITETWKKRPTY